jgi:hypothetical protein
MDSIADSRDMSGFRSLKKTGLSADLRIELSIVAHSIFPVGSP